VRLVSLALLFAISTPALRAQDFIEQAPKRSDSKGRFFRRLTLAAACAASAGFDTFTTRRAISAGAVESNGLLAGAQGNPSWGRVIGLKTVVCAVSATVQETHTLGAWDTPKSDWIWTAANAATASVYTWAGFHNLKLANNLSSEK